MSAPTENRGSGDPTLSEVPTVSVVLPVHNRSSLVTRAIDSVLAQTYRDIELIAVDDASTDDTPDTLAGYSHDPRFRTVRNAQNLGAAGTRNVGIGLARGRYLAFQDSDDRWFPEKLETQLKVLQASADCRACYSGAVYYSKENSYYIPREGARGAPKGDIFADTLMINPTTPQTLLIERSLLTETGVFDDSLRINEDWDLALRLARATQFAFVPEPMVMIYRTPDSVSSHMARDTAFRVRMLDQYAEDFAHNTAARSRQNYVLGSQYLALGDHRNAMRYFAEAMRDVPSSRGAAQMLRVALSWSTRWARKGR
ncbi:MAG: glycosyltransferase family 2 protein [Rhodobacteraceae bacterium]|nr:glycosyltransferase family 2 protein [Paracoccaceae bacterium]